MLLFSFLYDTFTSTYYFRILANILHQLKDHPAAATELFMPNSELVSLYRVLLNAIPGYRLVPSLERIESVYKQKPLIS